VQQSALLPAAVPTDVQKLAAGFALRMYTHIPRNAEFAYMFDGDAVINGGECFLVAWSFGCSAYASMSRVQCVGAGAPPRVQVDTPAVSKRLFDILLEHPLCVAGGHAYEYVEVDPAVRAKRGRKRVRKVKQLPVHRVPILWDDIARIGNGLLRIADADVIEVPCADPNKKRRRAVVPADPDGPPPLAPEEGDGGDEGGGGGGGDDSGGDGSDDDKELVADLEEILGAAFDPGRAEPPGPDDDGPEEEGSERSEGGEDLDDIAHPPPLPPAPPPPAPPPPLGPLNASFQAATVEVKGAIARLAQTCVAESRRALADAVAEAARAVGDSLEDRTISLIEHDDSVVFAYWTHAARHRYRPITIWKGNRVKAIVPARVPEVEAPNCRIIVHRTPAVMMMRKASEGADVMPEWCLRLHVNAEAALYGGPIHVEAESAICTLCVATAAIVGEGAVEPLRDELHRAHCCNTLWHAVCTRTMAAFLGDPGAGEVAPDMISKFTCGVCALSY